MFPKTKTMGATKKRPQSGIMKHKPIGSGWNNSTTSESKYFDKNFDKEY